MIPLISLPLLTETPHVSAKLGSDARCMARLRPRCGCRRGVSTKRTAMQEAMFATHPERPGRGSD
eukprot:7725942-Lingulodinium_polyedra.AAC.1